MARMEHHSPDYPKIKKRIDEEIALDEIITSRHPRVNAWWGGMPPRSAYARANFVPFLES